MSHNTTYIPPIGRLALDRYDFKKHVDGTGFFQEATSILLTPGVVIDGYNAENVRVAIIKLRDGGGGGGSTFPGPTIDNIDDGTLDDVISDESGTAATVIRFISQDGSASIAGIAGGTESRILIVLNLCGDSGPGDTTLELVDEGLTSLGINRLNLNGENIFVPPNKGAILLYDITSQRWRLVGFTDTGGGGGSPGGSDTEFQYNDLGSFAGTSDFVFDAANGRPRFNIGFLIGDGTNRVAIINDTTPTGLRVWQIPDSDDLFVGNVTSATLTNKTIVLANNTITDTGAVAGGVLIHNGTKYVNTAKGADGTFLGVSGGVVSWYSASGSSLAAPIVNSSTGNLDDVVTTSSGTPVYGIQFTGAAPVVRGLASGSGRSGAPLHLSTSGGPLVLKHEDSGEATATNRLSLSNGEDVRITDEGGCFITYNSSTSRWHLVGRGDEDSRLIAHTHSKEHLWQDATGSETTSASDVDVRTIRIQATTTDDTYQLIGSVTVPIPTTGIFDLYRIDATLMGGGPSEGTHVTSYTSVLEVDEFGPVVPGSPTKTVLKGSDVFDSDITPTTLQFYVDPIENDSCKWGIVVQLTRLKSLTAGGD